MPKWLQIGGNPHIHKWWKSGKIVHKFNNVEKWKTPLKYKLRYNVCGKLLKAQIRIPNKCELFYNSLHKTGDCYE